MRRWIWPALAGVVFAVPIPWEARAASSQEASLSVRPFAHVPPSTINTLVATPGAVEGQLQLQWVAPTVLPGSDLEAYQIRVLSNSVADVGGSTSTWWNQGGGLLIQGLYGESPGATVTRTIGPPGSSHTASLSPGATYYIAVRSADDLGAQADFWSAIDVPIRGSPYDAPPGIPGGVALSTGPTSLTVSWNDLSATDKGSDFDRYRVYRSTRSGNSFTLIGSTTGTTYTDASVLSGTRYYYRVTAIDLGSPGSPGTALESPPSSEVNGHLGGSVTNGKPAKPGGLYATLATDGTFLLTWRAVTQDIQQNDLTVDHYRVDQYAALDDTVVSSTRIDGTVHSYSEAVRGRVAYYRVVAVGLDGTESDPTDYVDSDLTANRYAVASDDPATRVLVPSTLQSELLRETNGLGEDIDLVLARRPSDEIDTTLRSYRITAYKAISREEVRNFSFSQPLLSVQLGFGASIQSNGRLTANERATLAHAATNNSLDQTLTRIVSVYWYNGGSFIPMGSPVLTTDQSLSVNVRNLGIYQLRVVRIGDRFRLSNGSPYPRLITPHEAAQNNRVFFFFDNPTDEAVSGSIYDLRGAKVRDLAVDGSSPSSNCIVWDGKDSHGSIVPTGIYLYRIRAGKDSASGTVVVAE